MNSLERVKEAIHFEKPDRAPVIDLAGGHAIILPLIPSYWQGVIPFRKNGKIMRCHPCLQLIFKLYFL